MKQKHIWQVITKFVKKKQKQNTKSKYTVRSKLVSI